MKTFVLTLVLIVFLLLQVMSPALAQNAIVTITQADGSETSFSSQQPNAIAGLATRLNPIVTGDWAGTNDVNFTVISQTSIDTFNITFRNVGGCSKVSVKTSPVSIVGGGFSISYNIPTISSGSLNGTFTADGQSCNGTFSYTNNQCGGSTSGSWSAQLVNVPPTTLNPPTNLRASLSANIVTLSWEAPTAIASLSKAFRAGSPKITLSSVVPKTTPAVHGIKPSIPIAAAPFNVVEVEPNNYLDQAQTLSGPSPAVVDGSAEISDQGGLTIHFDAGADDDVEDLFAVTTQSAGLNL
ncbi:MAG TPA: hypothetical protein VGA99_07525, partial [bacterium]